MNDKISEIYYIMYIEDAGGKSPIIHNRCPFILNPFVINFKRKQWRPPSTKKKERKKKPKPEEQEGMPHWQTLKTLNPFVIRKIGLLMNGQRLCIIANPVCIIGDVLFTNEFANLVLANL
jgi:hypothetical protein